MSNLSSSYFIFIDGFWVSLKMKSWIDGESTLLNIVNKIIYYKFCSLEFKIKIKESFIISLANIYIWQMSILKWKMYLSNLATKIEIKKAQIDAWIHWKLVFFNMDNSYWDWISFHKDQMFLFNMVTQLF